MQLSPLFTAVFLSEISRGLCRNKGLILLNKDTVGRHVFPVIHGPSGFSRFFNSTHFPQCRFSSVGSLQSDE